MNNKYSYDQLASAVPECTLSTLEHLCTGKSVRESAQMQGLHFRTVQKHVARIAATLRERGESDATTINVMQYLIQTVAAPTNVTQLPDRNMTAHHGQHQVAAAS